MMNITIIALIIFLGVLLSYANFRHNMSWRKQHGIVLHHVNHPLYLKIDTIIAAITCIVVGFLIVNAIV